MGKCYFRVRVIEKRRKRTIQEYYRFGNAKKQAITNPGSWVEGLIGNTWYELKI